MVQSSMKTTLTICVLAVIMTAASARMPNTGWKALPGGPLHAGLVVEADNTSPAAADKAKTCDHVTFTRSVKYGDSDRNVLDVAPPTQAMARRVRCWCSWRATVFRAMARRPCGRVAAPAGDVLRRAERTRRRQHVLPPRARRALAGRRQGCRRGDVLGASEHRPVRRQHAGDHRRSATPPARSIWRASSRTGNSRRRFRYRRRGAGIRASIAPDTMPATASDPISARDASKYDDSSAFPGLTKVDVPIVLAWSSADPQALRRPGREAEGHALRRRPLPAHRAAQQRVEPRIRLRSRRRRAPTCTTALRQLIGQIDARGLP